MPRVIDKNIESNSSIFLASKTIKTEQKEFLNFANESKVRMENRWGINLNLEKWLKVVWTWCEKSENAEMWSTSNTASACAACGVCMCTAQRICSSFSFFSGWEKTEFACNRRHIAAKNTKPMFLHRLTYNRKPNLFSRALLFVVTFAIQKSSAVGLFEWQFIGKLNANVIKCKLFNHISYNVCGKRNKKKKNFLDGKTRPTPCNRLFFFCLLLLLSFAFSDSEW